MLKDCDAWSQERDSLVRSIGRDLDLKSVVQAMLESKDVWLAITRFADTVMLEKENRERARQLEERNRGRLSPLPSLPSSSSRSSSRGPESAG